MTTDRTLTDRPQRALAQLRAHLLHGRGPGASAAEIATHTRDHPQLGSEPTARELDRTATQTSRARTGHTDPDRLMRWLARGLRLAVIGVIVGTTLRHVVRGRPGPVISRQRHATGR